MELYQEQKCHYLCQFCNQIFSNGDENLCHTRGHVALLSGTQEQSITDSSNEDNVVSNSKHISDSICKKCETEFNSIKKSQQSEQLSSSSSENGKFGTGVKLDLSNVIRKKRSIRRHTNPNNDPSSSFSYDEAEGAALGLMMFSRGLRDSDVIRVKNVISANLDFYIVKSNLRSNGQDVRDKGKKKDIGLRKSKDYKCLFCFKKFGSGQALGGHVRIHYMAIKNKTELKDDKTGSFKVRRCLDFDP